MTSPTSAMNRRSLLTALVGACVAVGAVGSVATSVAALPLPQPAKREPDLAEASPEAVDGEAKLHQAQYFVVRRRPRRRWFWGVRRRRRRYYW